ncbi:CHAT domain-containing protein [Candidatus Protochlamydia amoebophila]|uniref:CHAT domain-containing protein n=1 Tax=Candidatus Protochlamydia amoebophila TaxID=362787 RepID=A0A0C1K4V7_9BACT|nr:CHAT domain-containing protein [Candidatus Protochlamydia amoebophila]KIC74347.1 hypothetical protein DB44_AL00410 [Candidatus Protochlamydia amoebophila]
MNIESVKFSTPYYSPFLQSSQIFILDQVKDLIEIYKTKSRTEENIITSAKLLFEEINRLEDIGIKRECLCRLLKLEIEEVQNLIVKEVAALFDILTLSYDIQHDQIQQLIDFEEIVSEIMEAKLKSNEFNLFIPICVLYQNILEHLWLLPHLKFNNYYSHLLNQNKNAILKNMERWKNSLDQLANEEKIDRFIPKNLEMAVLRLFEPLPEAVAKEIEGQKTIIHKNREIPLALLEIIADYYGNQLDFNRAIPYAKIFLKLLIRKLPKISHKEEGVLIKSIQIHTNLASWNRLLRQYPTAIYHSEKALEIAHELCHPYVIIISLKGIGLTYAAQKQSELALPFFQKAQAIAQTLQDSEDKSQILNGLAYAYLFINKNDEAISCFETALNLIDKKSEQAWIYSGIGHAHAEEQRYQLAKEAYQKALELLAPDDFVLAIKIHESLAILFNHFGQYGKAISQLEKVLELIQHPPIQVNELDAIDSKLRALTILGNIYSSIGDYARELDYKRQAVKVIEKSILFSTSLGTAYNNLGNAYDKVKNYSESIKYYIKALKITEDGPNQAKFLVNVGHAYNSYGKFAEAIICYKKANKIDDPDIKKHSLIGLGLCYYAMGNTKKAIQCIEKSICLSQESKDRRSEAVGYHYLGEIYRKSDPKLAEENYRKSIAISAALHQELKNYNQWQITFFEKQALPLLRLERFLLQQSKIEEALQVTDFRRSRALVSALTEKFQFQKDDSLISSGLTAQEMQSLAQKLNTCLIVYSFVSESKNNITAWIIPSQGEINCQQLSLGNLTEEIKEATQVFKTFPFIVEPTVAKRRPFLRPKKTRSSVTYAFLDELTRGDPDESANPAVLQSFKERLSLWYEAFIAPLESYLPKDPQQVVTIIPDGFLAQIPFAAFLDKEGTHLIEKHPISIAPSVGILKLLDEIPKAFSENSLVIGNPTTPHSKDALPLAKKEAQTIVAPLLKITPERTLLQESATAQRVLEGMVDARWIHLACHGSTGAKPEEKLDPHSVFEGLFKLAPDESHSKGYLHAQEIVPLTLRTELVFMSACFSGRGKLHGEGSVGPVWSFLAAGALSTVATYWRLPDSDLTLQMVDTFYRHLLGIEVEKLNKAQALQKAMLTAIEQKREKPHLWGAFFLSGLHE